MPIFQLIWFINILNCTKFPIQLWKWQKVVYKPYEFKAVNAFSGTALQQQAIYAFFKITRTKSEILSSSLVFFAFSYWMIACIYSICSQYILLSTLVIKCHFYQVFIIILSYFKCRLTSLLNCAIANFAISMFRVGKKVLVILFSNELALKLYCP